MALRFLYTALCLLLALGPAYAACERAQEHYQQATAPGVAPAEQIRLLEGLLQHCDSFAASYALGRAYAAQENVPRSLAALRQAAHTTTSAEEKAWAWHTMARLHESQHDPLEALFSYKTAWRLARLPQVARDMLTLERTMQRDLVSAQQIVTTLRKGLELRSIGVVPAIDVRFAFDSAALLPQGEGQAHEIGLALTDPGLHGQRFRLIGHADSRGPHDYNDRLSYQRALSVQQYVLQHFALPVERLAIAGRGKRELLYPEAQDETEHALNRRVEVRIE